MADRGAVQQRHKKEWKTARNSIDTMKKERLKLRKSDLDEKAERKGITREVCTCVFFFLLRLRTSQSRWHHPQIKTALERVKRRQKRELELWDAAHAGEGAEVPSDGAAVPTCLSTEGDDPSLLLSLMGDDEDMGEDV